MSTGSGLGSLLPVAITVVGIVSMLRTRQKRRNGTPPTKADTSIEDRRAAAAEMERRMASYLAQRDTGLTHRTPEERNGQENGR